MGKKGKHATPVGAEFGTLLARLFRAHGIQHEHFIELGRVLAELQQPPRHIPYHPMVIEGWLSGELLPSYPAMITLEALLNKGPEGSFLDRQWEQLAELHEDAGMAQDAGLYQPTELTYLLERARKQLNLKYEFLAQLTGYYYSQGEVPKSTTGVMYQMKGHRNYSASPHLTHFMQSLLAAQLDEADSFPNLDSIHEQMLRERADSLWQDAGDPPKLGVLIHAMRARMGATHQEFREAIYRCAGLPFSEHHGTGSVEKWELGTVLPVGHSHHDGSTLHGAMADLMKIVDAAPNPRSQSIATPWFDADKETLFREAFTHMVENRNGGIFHYEIPQRNLRPEPNVENVSPKLLVTRASLSGRILNGRTARPSHAYHGVIPSGFLERIRLSANATAERELYKFEAPGPNQGRPGLTYGALKSAPLEVPIV